MSNIARPVEYDANILADKLLQYVKDTEQPFIQEFCLQEDVNKDTLYRLEKDNKALSDAMKKALEKQELYILQNASTGKINPVFGIFRLKQKCFGYTDKAELDITATPGLPDRSQLQAELQSLLAELPAEQRQFLLSSGE